MMKIEADIAMKAESLVFIRCRCDHDGHYSQCEHRRDGRCHISADEIGRAIQEERNRFWFLKRILDKEREEHKAAIAALSGQGGAP